MSNYYPNRDKLWSGFPTNWSLLKRLMWVRIMRNGGTPPEYLTVTGNPVTFETVRPYKLRQLKVAFSPVQAGSGDPSPDNVRPISGWSSLGVEQAGKNLFNPSASVNSIFTASIADALAHFKSTGEYAAGYVSSDNVLYDNPSYITSFTPIKSGKEYSIKNADPTMNFSSILFLDDNGNIISRSPSWTTAKYTHTALPNEKYIMCGASRTNIPTAMIVFGDTMPAEYVPYNPLSRSISISLGQTVYSGWVDVVTGVGDDGSFAFVMDGTSSGDCNMYDTGTAGYKRLGILIANSRRPRAKKTSGSSVVGNIKCNIFKSISADAVYMRNTGIAQSRNGDVLTMYREDLQTVRDWMAFFAENPMQVVYEVDEPTPISLTPQEVESLAGDNVLFSDANGDLTVEYRSN